MGAQPRPERSRSENTDLPVNFNGKKPRKFSLPRWAIILSVIAYCAIFWVLILQFGSWAYLWASR